VWRAILVVFGISLAAPGATGTAQLAIEARTGMATSVLVFSQATLRCDGAANATAFLRDAARPACSAVRRGAVERVAARQRHARICSEGYAGPQSARITGTVDGRRVQVLVSRSDGCGIADWEALRPLLGDPERRGRIPAPTKTTAPTTTEPPVVYQVQRGDTLTQIARHFRTTVGAIAARNQLTDPDRLTEGQSLVIPPASDIQLVATLFGPRDGAGFRLTLRGAQPSEPVTFEIDSPDGTTYTGKPHVASAEGEVATTYNTEIGSGVYTVIATGDQGSNATISFHVDPGR
jgi:LysM repeat protein